MTIIRNSRRTPPPRARGIVAVRCLWLLLVHSRALGGTPAAAPAACADAGMGAASKHSCLDYACMNLCHMSHVRKKCALTCGVCQKVGGGQKQSMPLTSDCKGCTLACAAGMAPLTFILVRLTCTVLCHLSSS